MVRAASGYTPRNNPRNQSQDFGLSDRLNDLEFELGQTREELAKANAESRRYDLRQGVVDEQAYESQDKVRESATKMIAELEASGTTSGSEYERLAQMAETGASYHEPTFANRLLGLIDVPARLLRSSVLDFTQLDKKLFGQEIDSSDNIKDIMLQRNDSLRRRNQPFNDSDAKWTDDIFNMNRVLEEAGLPDASEFDVPFVPEWGEKFGRGAVHFAAEMLGDPLSYVSAGASAIGKPVARASAKGILNSTLTTAAEAAFRGSVDDVVDTLASAAARRLDESKHVVDEAVRQARKDGLDEVGQNAAREAAERNLRDKIEREMEKEIMQPLLRKDFAALPDYFKKSDAVVKQNPALLGGIRPTLPLGSGLKGVRPVPGTVGLGRKINRTLLGTRPGTEARGFLGMSGDEAGTGLAKLFDAPLNRLSDTLSRFSNTEHGVRAAVRGDVAIADTIENGLNRAKKELGLRELPLEIAARSNKVTAALRGIDGDELAEVDRAFIDAVQAGRFKSTADDPAGEWEWPAFLDDEQVEALTEFGTHYDRIFREYKDKARQMGIDLGPHENYVPLVYDRNFERALRVLADSGASIDLDDLPEGLEAGLSWLTEALAATQRRNTKNQVSLVGETGHAQTRNLGREASVTDIDGITMFNVSEEAQVQFASHAEINDQMTEAIKWLAQKERISIPKISNALENNPVTIMNRYSSSMGRALQERWLMREMRQVGAIRSADFRTDLQRLAARHIEMASTAGETLAAQARVDRIEKTLRGLDEELADPFRETKNIALGPHGKVALPARAVRAKDKRLEEAVKAAQRKSKAYELAKTTHAREVENAVTRLTARGIPEGEARMIAESTGRRELKQVARRSRDLALDEAREEIKDVLDAARRMEGEAAEWEKAYASATRAAEKAERAATRAASKAQEKINKQVAAQARKNAEGSFPRMSFNDTESAEELVTVFRQDLTDQLTDLAADLGDEGIEEAIEGLKNVLASGSWDEVGSALNEFLNVGRRVRQAQPELSEAEFDLLSGPVMDVLRKARDNDLIELETWNAVKRSGLRPGEEDADGRLLWDWLGEIVNDVSNRYGLMYRNALQNGMTPGVKSHLAKTDEILDELHKAKNVIGESLNTRGREARIDQILEGSALRGELNALRKLALGQKVMSNVEARQGLERVLGRAGMIGPEISLEAAPSAKFGFTLVDRSGLELPAPATDLVDRAIGDGLRARQYNPELAYLADESTRAVAEARIVSKLRKEVLEPLTRKSTTMTDLEKAYRTFNGMRRQLSETIAPLDRVNVDLVGQHVEKVIALKRAADGGSSELLRAVDSANNLRTLYFDPDTTIESLENLGRDLAQDIVSSDRAEQQAAYALVEKIDETLRGILGLTRTPDGLVRRGFASAEEEETIARMLEQGKKAWRQLGLPEKTQPFHRVETPTVTLPNFVSVRGRLEGQLGTGEVVQVDAARWLENVLAVQLSATTPEGVKDLSAGMRAVLKIWKAQATVARPTFHIRNFIGAFWNGQMADTRIQDYHFAFSNTEPFLRALKKYDTVDEAIASLDEGVQAVYRNAFNDGIFDDSFAATEIISNRMHRRTLNRFNPLSAQEGFVVKAGGRAMMSIESNMRMAVYARHFRSLTEAGVSEAAAGAAARQWVNMVHFDYSNLSEAEEWARSIAPFFVWMRRNLPLQMRMILENPRFMARYDHLLSAVDGQTDDMHADDLPNGVWRQGTMYANLGTMNADTPFWARVLLDVDLPLSVFEDVTMDPRSWASMFANQLGPQFDVAKLFAEEGDDYFTTAPGGISQLLNLIPFDTPGAEKNPYGVTRLSPTASAAWRLAFPALNELGGFMLEQDPKRRANLGQGDLVDVDGDDDWLSDARAGALMMARGLGVQLESAGDVYGNTGKAQFGDLPSMKQELRRTGKITPEAEEAVEKANKEMELAQLLESFNPTDVSAFRIDSGE